MRLSTFPRNFFQEFNGKYHIVIPIISIRKYCSKLRHYYCMPIILLIVQCFLRRFQLNNVSIVLDNRGANVTTSQLSRPYGFYKKKRRLI